MLYSEQMKQIIEHLGVDPSTCQDGLYSTLLQTICDACGGGGGGGQEYADLLKGIIEGTATDVVLPEGITRIADNAFYYTTIEKFHLPTSLVSVGNSAFARATALTEVTFKGTPTEIYSTAFGSCKYLTTINVPWAEGEVANAPWSAANATINYNYTGG